MVSVAPVDTQWHTHTHTHTHTLTLGRIPLDEESARLRHLYRTTHNIQ